MMKRVLPRKFNNSKLRMLFVVMLFDSLLSIFCDAVGDQLLLHRGKDVGHEEGIKGLVFPEASSSRKLLPSSSSAELGLPRPIACLIQRDHDGTANRIGTACSKGDIVIFQGSTEPLPNGIPSFSVQILNVCVSGCSISDIHVSCGWFSSARLVNPSVFRRVHYDDCLVNDGEALGPGESLSFDYANSFSYPLSVSSVACCC